MPTEQLFQLAWADGCQLRWVLARATASRSGSVLAHPALEVGAQEADVLADPHARKLAVAGGVTDPGGADGKHRRGLGGSEQRLAQIDGGDVEAELLGHRELRLKGLLLSRS